jgi:hypothetical protein
MAMAATPAITDAVYRGENFNVTPLWGTTGAERALSGKFLNCRRGADHCQESALSALQ